MPTTLAEYPHLVAQLDRKRNGRIDPHAITYASNRRLWWRCPKGEDHVWQAAVSHRTARNSGCPFCKNQRVSVTNSLAALAPALAREWHPTKNGDLRPRDVVAGGHRRVWWKCPKGPDHEWCVTVQNRTQGGYGCPFCAGKRASKANNLAEAAPAVARQWHPTANGALRPRDVLPASRHKVWWRCPVAGDHVWQAIVADRATRGSGCPFCSGHAVSETNALSKVARAVARQWHPTKNGDLGPGDVVAGSHRRVWWKCPKGPDHEWRAAVEARTVAGNGCPFCSRRRATLDRNLAVVAPAIAREWHPTKNGDVRPSQVAPASAIRFWWICKKRHEWRAPPKSRVTHGSGCPYCSHHKVSPESSLLAVLPAIAKEWHPTKNGELTPADVLPGSGTKVWWKCRKGPDHEWLAAVGERKSRGCPFCAGRRASATTSLAARAPKIAAEWHPTKNGKLTPRDVTVGSTRRVWWRCPKGPDHEWQTAIANRKKTRCPFCMNRKISVTNSLAVVEPKVAAEWHPTRNGKLTARHVTRGAHHMVWWRCQFGHEWKATVNHRTAKNAGCPACAKPRRRAVAVTGRRRRGARFASYEGARHGPVRRVR